MSSWHLLWVIPALLAVLVGVWWFGRRASNRARTLTTQMDPERIKEERRRIRDHADWKERLGGDE